MELRDFEVRYRVLGRTGCLGTGQPASVPDFATHPDLILLDMLLTKIRRTRDSSCSQEEPYYGLDSSGRIEQSLVEE